MPRYSKNNTKELKAFLYNSHIHDAKLEEARYDCREDSITIKLFNPIFGVQIHLTFLNIGIALTKKGDWFGDRETINSLTVEDDLSYLQNVLLENREYLENSLYLLFQMFSGDELHIVSKEVIIEIIG